MNLIECRDAADLIAKLDPSESLWSPFKYGGWIYRGQADASWDLTPRALRRGQRLSFTDPAIVGFFAESGPEHEKQADFACRWAGGIHAPRNTAGLLRHVARAPTTAIVERSIHHRFLGPAV